MTKKVVIDKPILGWGKEHKESLLKKYADILPVGEHTDLPQRSADHKIAHYCKENNCDLITTDMTAFTHYFEVGIKTIKITRIDQLKNDGQFIYRIEIDLNSSND